MNSHYIDSHKEMLFNSPRSSGDWLEATLNSLDAQRSHDINNISTTYSELLNKVAAIRTKEQPVSEDIEIIRTKFVGLLDLCGIKDANIPLFDEPLRRRGTRQTLITSFGIMSKTLNAAVTPTRNRGRPSSRNTGNYADMLIEHLLANVSPDSETSPPSTEDHSSGLSSMGSRQSPRDLSSRQRRRNPPPMVPHGELRHLSRHAHLTLAGIRLPSRGSGNGDSHPPAPVPQPTSDSGNPTSEGSRTVCSPTSLPTSQDEERTLQNATSGSTPELPVSESSESLDIPYASIFDNEEYLEKILDFRQDLSADAYSDNSASPSLPQASCYRFPVRYSHSYARELHAIEVTDTNEAEAVGANSAETDSNNHSSTPFDEPFVVHLPEKEPSLPPRVNFNINDNYKPHLEDKSGLVSSDSESPKPPIPPRRPLTDSKVGQFVLQSDNSNLGALWCRQTTTSSDQESPCHQKLPVQVKERQKICMTTGKAYLREKQRQTFDIASPRRNQRCSPHSPYGSLSASKRRKGNDRSALPVDHDSRPPRPVRQRLFGSPHGTPPKAQPPAPSSVSTPPQHQGPRSERLPKKRYSPAMRRLIQQKESNLLSPLQLQNSPRRPLSEIYNICHNDSDPLTTSSNSLTPSSDAYAKSSETSPDLPLPSREEELRDRDAHYCDFTLDRQHKIDTLSPKQRKCLYNRDVKENHYILEDPTTKEVLVRQVEGAESSPNSPFFQVPKLTAVVPPVQTQLPPVSNPNRSSARSSSGSRRSSSSSSRKSDRRRRPSRSNCRGPTNSHPMASSTMLEDPSPETDDGASTVPSIYTWTIEEVGEPYNLEKSYIRSRQARRALIAKPVTPRPPTSVGRDSPVNAVSKTTQTFEITAMVSEIDRHLNESALGYNTQIENDFDGGASHSSYGPRLLAGAPSLIAGKAVSKISLYSDDIGCSSQQASTSSMVFNRARASIQCSSNEPSDIPDLRQISSVPSSGRTLSSSAPELLIPSSHDVSPDVSELSILEDREDIPGKSSSSGSSSCTAARCRPRVIKPKESNIDVESVHADQPTGHQDLIDSILTDSPKSVDSSGIFAPYNSYNSPAESVGSHNGYSSTVSSSVASSDNYFQLPKPRPMVPPPTPSRPQSSNLLPINSAPKTEAVVDKFKRPFNPVPHVSHTLRLPSTRNQGVSAMACFITPRRPMSVRSDPLANKSIFAVPPGVVTGPPKISDKKSLVKKLKKFSTNFYKKNEKIRTLANL